MKKLALFLALCLLFQAIGLTAFAEGKDPAVKEAVVVAAPAEEQDGHLIKGYIQIKAGTKIYTGASTKNVLGTVTADSYAYAESGKTAKDPAEDWLKIYFDDARSGKAVTAYVQAKNIRKTEAAEQVSVINMLAKQNARMMNGKPVPKAEYTAEASANRIADNGDASNFVLDENDCICEYNGDWEALVLPTKVDGVKVQGITETAFRGNTTIKSISIPSTGYTIIENGAFKGCTSLESVSMANPVTSIVAEAFMGCTSLKAISWPAGLTDIEHDAFNGCTSLQAIGMTSNLVTIGDNAFKGCTSIKDFDMEDANSLTEIGSSAFSGCTSLRAIILPKNLKTLKNSAFENCSGAKTLSLPKGLKRIEGYTFRNCSSLKHVKIKSKTTFIGTEAFANCSGLEYVIIPKSVEYILKGAFKGIGANTVLFMTGITKIKISDGAITTGIVVGDKNQDPHNYVKTHSGPKFVSKDAVSYIKRAYKYLLKREYTSSERLTWIRNLANGTSAVEMVRTLMNSAECKGKKYSNSMLIKRLYRVMFKRSKYPAKSEYKEWMHALEIGMTMEGVLRGIGKSTEHKTKCSNWLITPGELSVANYRDYDLKYTEFVLYTLQWAYRAGDVTKVTLAELENSCRTLVAGKMTAYTYLHGILNSKEVLKITKDRTAYVQMLYKLYLGRSATATEAANWARKITDKKSRLEVENAIRDSNECIRRFKKIGLTRK